MSSILSQGYEMATDELVEVDVLTLGPFDAGVPLTVEEFEAADFELGHQYELVYGLLVVNPVPFEEETDENEELGLLLRIYQKSHPHGSTLDLTLPERYLRTATSLRKPDRVIWAGLGRLPITRGPIDKRDLPAIFVEFPSIRATDLRRDYEEKRDEYRDAGVKEYWIIDRFRRHMTVFSWVKNAWVPKTIAEREVYTTELLPWFELKPGVLFAVSDKYNQQ